MRPIVVMLSSALLLLGAMAANLYLQESAPKQDKRSQFLQGGEFTLESVSGKIGLSNFAGRPVLLYFGYTHCPDICPMGLSTIASALKLYPDKTKDIVVLFVTLDPERDNAGKLAQYVAYFSSQITGLSGSLAQIQQVARQYGVFFQKAEQGKDTENYGVEHTANFYLIDSDGLLRKVMDQTTSASELASALIAIK